ncbi:MAG: HAMP domain-containing sensor histidine kinase [Desulfuromonadaceae bacterium]|nr:HAMP domain-containing sensor histidine kinase [Desulfuromonadaceae bacterium]
MTLLDKNGHIIFSAGREGSEPYSPFQGITTATDGSYIKPDGSGIVHLLTIKQNGEAVAKAGLLISLTPERARLNRSRQMLTAYFILDFVLLLGVGSFILTRIVVRPIDRLLAATEKITGGQYGHRLNISGSAELARLAAAFNEMASALFSKDRQVADQVAALEKANNDLREAREETLRTEKMASIGLLAAGMAHEIGTPLASIMGYAELTASELPDNDIIQDYARRIASDSSRIDRIVRGLLDFSRPRSTGCDNADVRDVIGATLDLLSQQGAFNQITISSEFDDGALLAQCDEHQLQQVLINLLLNSCDATVSGGTITVRARRDGPDACLDVIDDGAGITEESLKHIFDPFFTTKQPGKGTGLGLAISARIVEGFGGGITVSSRVGFGSCFTVRLPSADLDEGGVS